jgi:Bacterial PH domain
LATYRIASPERRWRAAFLVLPAALLGWRAVGLFGPLAGGLLAGGVLSLAAPIMRTCLIVADDGLTDRRAIRAVRLSWEEIADFRVQRPGWLWGGFCVVAGLQDGTDVDLLSTRAYTRAPSSDHLDELLRICWTLQERLPDRAR